MKVKVRFAPSPTGYLHVGGARTAIFNWLFARKHGGSFVLRIEDTDVERSSEEMARHIIEALRWVGVDWDEGPYYQSQRLELYRREAERLVAEGKAYYCYCTPEELEQRRQEAERQGRAWKYDRRCLHLSEEERRRFEEEGRPKAIRFIVPEGKTEFEDLVHGKISFDNRNIEDFVLIKSDGFPTYHLSVVVDDHYMGITHVIRGDDHIANTPKQIMLYRAFGWEVPVFAHLPLILGPDRKKLSKRHGETSLLAFRDKGFLPLAMFNYLCQLSWSAGEDKEFYTVEELVERFSIEKVRKSSPVFDYDKLLWLNSKVLAATPGRQLLELAEPFLSEKEKEMLKKDPAWLERIADLVKDRCKTLLDLASQIELYVEDEVAYQSDAVEKYWKADGLADYLEELASRFEALEEFTAESSERVLRQLAEELSVKAAVLIHATRVAVLGVRVSPGIFDVLEVLGKERVVARLRRAAFQLRKGV